MISNCRRIWNTLTIRHHARYFMYSIQPLLQQQQQQQQQIIMSNTGRRPSGLEKRKQLVQEKLDQISELRPKVKEFEFSFPLSVRDLAEKLGVNPQLLLKFAKFPSGVTNDTRLSTDRIEEICLNLNVIPINIRKKYVDALQSFQGQEPKNAPPKIPVVTIMGHVDHGKTTLLDYLRKTNIADKEPGKITQHIGAFETKISSSTNPHYNTITFIDTPGHEAFSKMRATGAKVTDLTVLVVSADDGVQQQTLEAIQHAQESKVPMIVAINKIDLPSSSIEKTKEQLNVYGITEEEYPMIPISGLHGTNVNKLLDEILFQAELGEWRASQQNVRMESQVIECTIDKGLGSCATVIVKRGVLKVGCWFVCGTVYGKVRLLKDVNQKQITSALPGKAVELVGFDNELPQVGDVVFEVPDEETAKRIVSKRRENQLIDQENEFARQQELQMIEAFQKRIQTEKQIYQDLFKKESAFAVPLTTTNPTTTATTTASADQMIFRNKTEQQLFERKVQEVMEQQKTNDKLNLILKVDAQGTLDAFYKIIEPFPKHEVSIQVIREAIGPISETDIDYATAFANAFIVGMNVKVPSKVTQYAKEKNVPINNFRVIYQLIDYLKKQLSTLLPVKFEEVVVGEAIVKTPFEYSEKLPNGNKKMIKVAGSEVTKGQLMTSIQTSNEFYYRVLRFNKVIMDRVKVLSLQRFKDKVKEVKKGHECGVTLENYEEIKKDDVIQMIEKRRVERNFEEELQLHLRKQNKLRR